MLISWARLHSFFPGLAAVRPALIATTVAGVTLLAGQQGARKVQNLASPLGGVMAFFVVWTVITVPLSINMGNSANFLLNQFLREAVVILVVAASVRDRTDFERLLRVYGYGVIAFSVLGAGSGLRHVGGGGYDANDSAMFLVSGLPVILYFLVRARKSVEKLGFGLGLAATGSAIVLTGSRGGFLALIAVLGYSLFFLKGIKKSVRLGVVLLAGVIVSRSATEEFWSRMGTIGDEDDYNYTSYTGRKQIWTRGLSYMLDHPISGVGIDNFSVAEGKNPLMRERLEEGYGTRFSAPHSIWVQAGAELGVPGLAALITVFVLAFKALMTAERASRGGGRKKPVPELEPLGELGRPLVGTLIGVFVAGTFLSRAYSGLLWEPFALALALEKLVRLKAKELKRAEALRAREVHLVPGRAVPPTLGTRSS